MSAITTVTELLGELAKKGFKHADEVTAKEMRVLEDVTNAFKRGEDVAEDSLKAPLRTQRTLLRHKIKYF